MDPQQREIIKNSTVCLKKTVFSHFVVYNTYINVCDCIEVCMCCILTNWWALIPLHSRDFWDISSPPALWLQQWKFSLYHHQQNERVCVCVCMQICISTDWDWWSVQKRQKMAVMSNMFNTDNSQNSSVSVCAVEGTVSSCALNCNWAAGLYEAAINLSLLC